MHSLNSQFEELRTAIEPSKARKDDAKVADDPVREHLETDESFKDRHITTFLYGSYKRRTAICDIKDVDLVVVTNHTTDDDPLEVLTDLKDSLAGLYDETDLSDQRRSIRVNRPLSEDPDCEMTLDIIPAIYVDDEDGPLWVPDREKKKWVKSHPQGHIDNTSQLNADSHQGNTFVRLTKMMKWWWQYQWEQLNPTAESHTRKPKGFWIEVMCGQYADIEEESYPEQILALLENAFSDLKSYRDTDEIPELIDPGLPDQKITTSITDAEFSVFLNSLEQALTNARAARDAKDERTAANHWRKLFGDKFPLPAAESQSSLLKSAVAPAGLSFPPRPVVPNKPAGFAGRRFFA